MENSYQYFKRDLSWLSFNYRVLLEAEDDTLPIYERLSSFLSIPRIWKNFMRSGLRNIGG